MPEMPDALGAYIFAGGFTLGVKRHFNVLAHLEESDYGVATMRHNQPEIPVYFPPERWPLDQWRDRDLPLIYGNPPCFSPDTRVMTVEGPKSIKELVRTRSKIEVLSITETGERVTRRITGWHENPYNGYLYDVLPVNPPRGGRSPVRARCTAEHRFLTRRGWVRAVDLTDTDEVCTGRLVPNDRQHALLDGMMLGDSQIKKHQAQLHVSQVSPEYVDLKRGALADFVCQHGRETVSADWGDGCQRKPRSWFYLRTEEWVKRERSRWYGEDGRKRVPAEIELTPLTLAAWYMDDGTLRRGHRVVDRAAWDAGLEEDNFGPGVAHLCTDNFTQADVDLLIDKLNAMGVNARRAGTGIGRSEKYPRIVITAEGMPAFMTMIGPYVLPEMRYKLNADAPLYDPSRWQLGQPMVGWDRVRVKRARLSSGSAVYCLDVDETHNFVTYGGVAHNCAAWSVAGYTKTRGTDKWLTDPRVACTRRHFGLLEQLRPRAWVWESVTQAYTKGREFCEELAIDAMKLGYSVTFLLHDAQWIGLPQVRKRFFMVCHRVAYRPPAPNWSPPPTPLETLENAERGEPMRRDGPAFLKNFPPEVLEKVRPGERLAKYWEREIGGPDPERWERKANGDVLGRPSFGHYRLPVDRPGGAVVGYNLVHPTEPRFLSTEEMQVLSGFPREYVFVPRGASARASEIARGVCPPVGEWLARGLAAAVAANQPITEPVMSEVDYRQPPVGTVDQVRRLTPLPRRTVGTEEPGGERQGSGNGSLATLPVPARYDSVRPKPGVKRMAFLQFLIMTGRYPPEWMASCVRHHWPTSKCSVADVSTQRSELRRAGHEPPPARRA